MAGLIEINWNKTAQTPLPSFATNKRRAQSRDRDLSNLQLLSELEFVLPCIADRRRRRSSASFALLPVADISITTLEVGGANITLLDGFDWEELALDDVPSEMVALSLETCCPGRELLLGSSRERPLLFLLLSTLFEAFKKLNVTLDSSSFLRFCELRLRGGRDFSEPPWPWTFEMIPPVSFEVLNKTQTPINKTIQKSLKLILEHIQRPSFKILIIPHRVATCSKWMLTKNIKK